MPYNAADTAALRTAKAEREPRFPGVGFEERARSADQAPEDRVGEQAAVPPSTPPDAPAAMTEQALEGWSLTELAAVPGLGRLLSVVQRTAGVPRLQPARSDH